MRDVSGHIGSAFALVSLESTAFHWVTPAAAAQPWRRRREEPVTLPTVCLLERHVASAATSASSQEESDSVSVACGWLGGGGCWRRLWKTGWKWLRGGWSRALDVSARCCETNKQARGFVRQHVLQRLHHKDTDRSAEILKIVSNFFFFCSPHLAKTCQEMARFEQVSHQWWSFLEWVRSLNCVQIAGNLDCKWSVGDVVECYDWGCGVGNNLLWLT